MKNSYILNQRKTNIANNNIYQRNNSNSINQKNTQLTYSLKPKRYNIPKDVVPYKIFKNLISISKHNFPSMPKTVNLRLSELDNRSKIVYQIKNFVEKHNLNITSYFFSVYLMDQLLAKKINLTIDKLGFGSILLTTKFIEIDGKLPSIQSYIKYILNRRITSKEIIEIENECLKKLNHNLTLPQPINFLNIFLLNGIVFNTDENDNKKKNITSAIYLKPYDILSELISLNADYLKYNPLDLACACVAFARESYKLSKWHFVFEKIFNIYESKFNEAYIFVKNFNEEKKKIIEKNEQLRRERRKIENENNILSHNSCSTSNILITNSKRLITNVNNINSRNGLDSDSKTIYYKNKIFPFEKEKDFLQSRKDKRSLDITMPNKNRENSINLHDTAETSDLSISLKSYNKTNNNNNNEFIKINSHNKYYYHHNNINNINYINNIPKNINNTLYLNNSRLSIINDNNIKGKINDNTSYPRREIYSNSGNRINTLNNSNSNILTRQRNSSTIIESYSTKNNFFKHSNNNSSGEIRNNSNNISNYNSYNNRNYVNIKSHGGSITSSYQIKEIPVYFNRTISNIESSSRRFSSNRYAHLMVNKNLHK